MPTMNRRGFIRAASGAAAGLWLAGRLPSIQIAHAAPQRVVVLGGGLAGLSAAYELMKRGHDVTVLEAQSRVGGRVWTVRDGLQNGEWAEMGAVRIPDVHEHTIGYAEELGLTLDEYGAGDPLYYLKGNRFLHTDDEPWPLNMTEQEQAKGLDMWEDYIEAAFDEFGNPREGTFPAPGAMERYDGLTYRDFLVSRGASDDFIRLYAADNGSEIDEIGTLGWMSAESADRDWDATMYVRGGNDQIPRGLAEKLGARVLMEREVVRLEHTPTGVVVTFKERGGLQSISADRAVCAIPFTILRNIEITPAFAADKMRSINELVMMEASRTFIQTKSQFWKGEGIGGLKIAKTDTPAERIWDLSHLSEDSTGMMMCYMQHENAKAFDRVPDGERQEYILREIERFFPSIREQQIAYLQKSWAEDPWVRGAWTDILPGQGWMFSVVPRSEGRVHFAGEHTSIWAGWMQGAIESGKRAALEIDRADGVPS